MTASVDTQVRTLESRLDDLAPHDQEFARNLIRAHRSRRGMSEAQEPWVAKLIDRADGKVDPQPTEDCDFGEVYAIFETAAARIEWPKIRLALGENVNGGSEQLVMHRAGERSKYPGQINLTDGRRFPGNEWYGRIDSAGTWTKPRKGVPQHIEELVRRFQSNPAGVAAEHGKHTGSCCFCGRTLEDERSTEVGYGPVCAKTFGLPWGTKDAAEQLALIDGPGLEPGEETDELEADLATTPALGDYLEETAEEAEYRQQVLEAAS